MRTIENVKSHLRPGSLYRRSDLANVSKAIDQHLAELLEAKVLVRVRRGLYECPHHTRFGLLPIEPKKLVKSFLNTDHFLLASPNDFNALGVGTTQLYNYLIVYNHKRHGRFELGGQIIRFCRKSFPKKPTQEFLLVELLNNLDDLAEDRDAIRAKVQAKVPELSSKRLRSAVRKFSKKSTRKFLETILNANSEE